MPPKFYHSLVLQWCKLRNFVLFILPFVTISCSHIHSSPAGSVVENSAVHGTPLDIGNYHFRVAVYGSPENYILDTGEKRKSHLADFFYMNSGEQIVAQNSCKFSREPIAWTILAPGCRIQAGDSSIFILRIEAPVVDRAEGKQTFTKSPGTVFYQILPGFDTKN